MHGLRKNHQGGESMRGCASDWELFQPSDLPTALQRLEAAPGHWTFLAGGTDLMVRLPLEAPRPRAFMDLSRLEALKTLEWGPTHLKIGALCTYSRLRHFLCEKQIFPNLREACRQTGSPAIQNRGTLGGNLANASPCADSIPALLSYDALIELVSTSGARRVSLDSFYRGYKQMDLRPDELISAVFLPFPARVQSESDRHFYRKVGTRQAQAISKVCVAIHLRKEGDRITHVRIALGAVAPTVIRAKNTESCLMGADLRALSWGDLRQCLMSEMAPINDLRSTEHYRRVVSGNLLMHFLDSIRGD